MGNICLSLALQTRCADCWKVHQEGMCFLLFISSCTFIVAKNCSIVFLFFVFISVQARIKSSWFVRGWLHCSTVTTSVWCWQGCIWTQIFEELHRYLSESLSLPRRWQGNYIVLPLKLLKIKKGHNCFIIIYYAFNILEQNYSCFEPVAKEWCVWDGHHSASNGYGQRSHYLAPCFGRSILFASALKYLCLCFSKWS